MARSAGLGDAYAGTWLEFDARDVGADSVGVPPSKTDNEVAILEEGHRHVEGGCAEVRGVRLPPCFVVGSQRGLE